MEEQKKLIIIQDEDYLIDKIVKRLLEELHLPTKKEWVTENVAMAILGVKSKSYMWSLRTKGKLTYSKPSRKILLYSVKSINELIESNIKKIF